MLILGLVLLLAAGALTAGMLLGNREDRRIEVFGEPIEFLSSGELFTLGIATGVVAGLSLALVLSGLRRSGRKRRERRAELKGRRDREQELQAENARMARELDDQRRADGSAPMTGEDSPDQGGPDATQPMKGDDWQRGASGFERPAGPPSQAPLAGTDSPQEGRRPLS